MRKIHKGSEPTSLTRWKRKNTTKRYGDLGASDALIRQEIRMACAQEQYFLCAYCCKEISGTNNDCMNEHIQPQNHFPQLSLDFNNIVASCTTEKQCNDAHGSAILPLTPLMRECESELEFRLSGEVLGKTERACKMINILQLNNKKLSETRKQIIDCMLLQHGLGNPIDVEDDELLLSVCDDICEIDENGKMIPFAPVVVNVIKHWIGI